MKKIFTKRRGFISISALIVLTAVVFSGCGSSSKSVAADSKIMEASTSMAYAPAAKEAYYEEDVFYDEYGWAEEPAMATESMKADMYDSDNGSSYSTASDALSEAALSDRKLIKNVSLSMQTLEFDNCLAGLERAIASSGGYIQNSSVSNNPYSYTNTGYKYMRYANYTIRIPRERLDAFVKTVGSIGNITSQDLYTEDVTLSYLDTESRAQALKIQQERLLALLDKAEDIDSIISLEARLSEVTYELEAKERILKNYDNLVEYSTVNLGINEVERITYVEPEPISFGQRISEGLSDTFYDLKEGFKNFVYWLIVDFPYIIFWGGVIAAAVVIIVKKTKKSKMRKLEEKRDLEEKREP